MRRRLRTISKAISLKNGFFSVRQISKETFIGSKDVQIVLDNLFREGLVQRFDLVPNYPGEGAPLRGRPRKRTIYQVTDKAKFKERFGPKFRQDTALDRFWKIIRYQESFTVRDLFVLGNGKKENARWFVKNLSKARYISPFGSVGQSVQWGLIRLRDPGPKRPFLGDFRGRKKA